MVYNRLSSAMDSVRSKFSATARRSRRQLADPATTLQTSTVPVSTGTASTSTPAMSSRSPHSPTAPSCIVAATSSPGVASSPSSASTFSTSALPVTSEAPPIKATASAPVPTARNPPSASSISPSDSVSAPASATPSSLATGPASPTVFEQTPLKSPPAPPSLAPENRYLSGVVQVFATESDPEHWRPWVRERTTHSMGSGFVVPGRQIVTNAHCIFYSTVVRVQRHMSDEKTKARVLRINSDCDVAVLTVDEDDFWKLPPDTSSVHNSSTRIYDKDACEARQWEELPPFSLGPLPKLQDVVRVIGYPIFGTEISISQGVVSRIQLQAYSHSSINLLSVQSDSKLCSGGSGGPVLDAENRVVGIAFQSNVSPSNEFVSEFIPTCVFERFLQMEHCCNGEVVQVPGPAFMWQKIESKTMRTALGLESLEEPNNSGVLVIGVTQFGGIAGALKRDDVLVEVENVNVGNQGTIPFGDCRIGFSHLFTSSSVGDYIHCGVIRGGKRIDVSWQLASIQSSFLVPVHDKMKFKNEDPEYHVIAGMVFVGLTEIAINNEWNGSTYDSLTMMKYQDIFGIKEDAAHELVLLSQVLDHAVNTGFEGIQGELLHSFNGVQVKSLAHLAALHTACKEKFITLRLMDKRLIIIDRNLAEDSEQEIMLEHNIPAPSRIGPSMKAGEKNSRGERGARRTKNDSLDPAHPDSTVDECGDVKC